MLSCILPVLLNLTLLVGLFSLRRIVHGEGDETLQRQLSIPIQVMTLASLPIACMCMLFTLYWATDTMLTLSIRRDYERVSCVETLLTERYKVIIEQRRYGKEEASLADANGRVELVGLTQYSIAEDYLIGIVHDSYFWLNQKTGGHRVFDKKEDFLASANALSVSLPPELVPIPGICNTRDCRPCVKITPTR